MTEPQSKFIDVLLDQLGFQGSRFKVPFRTKFFGEYGADVEYASKIIERLLSERDLRRKPRRRIPLSNHVAVSDLAAFGFCPASYAIKASFEIEQLPGVEEGLEHHVTSANIEELVADVKRSQKRSKHNLTPDERDFYSDVFNSVVEIRGWKKDQKPLYTKGGEISGLPDYVFKHKDGSRFHVDERHTWREEITSPWRGHLIQAFGYQFALAQLGLTHSYLVYFKWERRSVLRAHERPFIFKIEKTSEGRQLLASVYRSVRELRESGARKFSPDWINVNKCFACSVRYYCHHKGGRNATLRIPYPR